MCSPSIQQQPLCSFRCNILSLLSSSSSLRDPCYRHMIQTLGDLGPCVSSTAPFFLIISCCLRAPDRLPLFPASLYAPLCRQQPKHLHGTSRPSGVYIEYSSHRGKSRVRIPCQGKSTTSPHSSGRKVQEMGPEFNLGSPSVTCPVLGALPALISVNPHLGATRTTPYCM